MERAVAALESDAASKVTDELVSVSTAIETLKNFLNVIQMWIADTTKKLGSIRKMQTIKCVLVGSSVGKTSLIVSYKNKDFEAAEEWPIPFEKIEKTVVIDDEPYTLHLVDTGSQEAYDCYRPFSYIDADVFLVCYSVVLPYSVDYVMEKWLPEIRHFCPNKPFLLVGTQIDLRFDKKILKLSQTPKSIEEGVKLAKRLKAVKYVECSAKFKDTVKYVFDEAVRATVKPSEKPKSTRRFKLF
ncbi:cell division control protein 42 homolog [Bradysia coprophila]|uniref:cell division control protein 42 homolog n=1 Tax=Bradysia coprophila TaxID=38358 RepID=UPI00187DA88E|nr:cell division control protein 42 homolog [Bradysia coprophila]